MQRAERINFDFVASADRPLYCEHLYVVISDSHTAVMAFRDSVPDRTVEVCRQFLQNRCDRSENKCRFAHPPPHCRVENGRVTCCVDHIKV